MKGSFIRKAVPPARMGLDGFSVWERGAEKREWLGGVESISSAGRATNPCFGKCDDVRFVVVGQIVECGNVLRSKHETSIEGADEEACRVGGTWIELDIPTEKQCGGE